MNKKILKFIVLVSITIIVISSVIICVFKKDKTSNKGNKKYGYDIQLLDYNGHKKKIDDYTITLMYTAYDKMSQIGFIEFEVKKQDGKVKMDIGDNGDAHSLIANRFGFDIMSTGERMEKYEMIDDVLHVYIHFTAEEDYDGTINLIDYNEKDNNTMYKHKIYEFKLKETLKSNEYKTTDKKSIYVSPVGIILLEKDKKKNMLVTLCYKNGKQEEVINTIKDIADKERLQCISDVVEDMGGYRYQFLDVKDVSNIESVTCNGEEYVLVK